MRQANATMCARTAEHAQELAGALAIAGAQLYHKEYDPATQRLVHAAIARPNSATRIALARYAERAEFCNPHRTGPVRGARRILQPASHLPGTRRAPNSATRIALARYAERAEFCNPYRTCPVRGARRILQPVSHLLGQKLKKGR
jgi:hypothetical protein